MYEYELPIFLAEKEIIDYLIDCTFLGRNWEKVVAMYYSYPVTHTMMIKESVGTALHVAVSLNKEKYVPELVNAILMHESEENAGGSQGESIAKKKGLEMVDERGDTPLHIAASKGLARICKLIIGENRERIRLLHLKNKTGETPLFLAAINWRKEAFAYLSHVSTHISSEHMDDLVRKNNRESILQVAIWRECFDLAIIIAHKYDFLCTYEDEAALTPLKVLATRPSAFLSGCNLSWCKRILYNCMPVESRVPEPELDSTMSRITTQPRNSDKMNFPNKCTTCYYFWSSWLRAALADLKDLKNTKQKHKWTAHLLNTLLERPEVIYRGRGGRQPGDWREIDSQFFDEVRKKIHQVEEEMSDVHIADAEKKESDSEFLVAAKNGIVEIVNKILEKVPSAIYNTNSKKENALLVAVRNRQPLVVERLRKVEPEVWNDLVVAMDEDENTVLHLAAMALAGDKALQVADSALQMMWDVKWFQYIKSLVPEYFYFRGNKANRITTEKSEHRGKKANRIPIEKSETGGEMERTSSQSKTALEIFKESHKDLVKESGEWLRQTSESCSVVAALIAGVSFATTSSVPGGNIEVTGKPTLQGHPAFHAFAIASLVGLFFSVTGLIMFLSILTSLKQPKDFRTSLPLKLLLGLSSLFVSIAAMFVSFCSGDFFVLTSNYKHNPFPIYAATCVPVTFYAISQLPLYIEILSLILISVPYPRGKGEILWQLYTTSCAF